MRYFQTSIITKDKTYINYLTTKDEIAAADLEDTMGLLIKYHLDTTTEDTSALTYNFVEISENQYKTLNTLDFLNKE